MKSCIFLLTKVIMKHIKHKMVTSNAVSVIPWKNFKMPISLLAVSFQHGKWLEFIFNYDSSHFLPLHLNSAFLFLSLFPQLLLSLYLYSDSMSF